MIPQHAALLFTCRFHRYSVAAVTTSGTLVPQNVIPSTQTFTLIVCHFNSYASDALWTV